MEPPLQPTDEARRLETLQQYDLLDTLPEQALDDLAALICAALSPLIQEKRQWFKSRVSLSAKFLMDKARPMNSVAADVSPLPLSGKECPSRLTSAATVRGFKARTFIGGNLRRNLCPGSHRFMVLKRNFGIAGALPELGRLENRPSGSGAGWAGKFFRAMTLVLLVFALAGCDKPAPPLRVGASVWPGYEPLFLARDLGYYGGQPVQLLSFFSNTEVMRAYRNGAIDVAAVTADEALLLAETLPDQRILLVCDVSHGADVILAKPQFPSLADLKGRRIGVETTALGAYMLAQALARAGLTAQDVTVVPTTLDEHEAAFRQDRVDAVVTFEPIRSRLLAAGAVSVFDSSQIPGEIVDVLLTRAGKMDSARQPLTALVRGWFKALDYLRQNPTAAARRMAVREQITPEAVLDSLQLLKFPDREANLRLLGASTDNLAATLHQLSTTMREHKLLERPSDPAALPDPRFIPLARP